MTTIISSNKSNYELYQITLYERAEEPNELNKLINLKDRYHIVDYDSRLLATAKTRQQAIEQANRVIGFWPDCVIDEKNLIAYDLKMDIYGAGHEVFSWLRSRY